MRCLYVTFSSVYPRALRIAVLDSLGSFPSGVLRGSLGEMGSYKQCFTAAFVDESGAPLGRKFCTTNLYYKGYVPEFPQVSAHQVIPERMKEP